VEGSLLSTVLIVNQVAKGLDTSFCEGKKYALALVLMAQMNTFNLSEDDRSLCMGPPIHKMYALLG
jgi:hypothetical protein